MMSMQALDTRFKAYFKGKRILIADDTSATRIAIARALSEMGAGTAQMSLTDSFDWAKELISRNHFAILICEYDLKQRCGLDLLSLLPDLSLSMVVTRNHTEVAAARAAERGVDVFLTKPFTVESFKLALANAIENVDANLQSKLNNEGVASESSSLRATEIEHSLESVGTSQNDLQRSDRESYRSLLGLHQALLQQRKKEEAYLVLRKIVRSYPLDPARLNSALRLAVETRHFDDVETYYQQFLKVDTKDELLVRHLGAALVMAGKAFLELRQLPRALEHFRKAAMSSGRKSYVLREIVLALVAYGHASEADSFLLSFSSQDRASPDFQALDYLVLSKLQPLHETLRKGRDLLKQGHRDSMVFRILIQASVDAGHLAEAESLAHDAARQWPSEGAEYRALLPTRTV